MKEFINWLSDPIISFPIVTILFFLMMKYYRIVGTKPFAIVSAAIAFPLFILFCMDSHFLALILWPDNVPISILLVLFSFLMWLCLHKASINDQRIERGECPVEAMPENREKVWCWPNLVFTELFAIIGCTVFLIVWAIVFQAPLEEPANPTWAPNPAKAPWYFLGLQEMLVYYDPWYAGVILPGLILVGLIVIPFIDTNPKGNGYYTFKERPLAIGMFLYGWIVLWFYMIIVGTFLRGPNWTFYGPFENWDPYKVVPLYSVNLSEIFWIQTFNMALPDNPVFRELPGLILVGGYVLAIPLIFIKTKIGQEIIERLGNIRCFIFLFLVIGMSSLPIKMVLRWLFNMKYIIALPEIELNF